MHRSGLVLLAVLLTLAPIRPTGAATQVEGNTYTSPQFGHRVTWRWPWQPVVFRSQENPISVPGESDYLLLTDATEFPYIDFVYQSFFSSMTASQLLDGYIEHRRKQHPDIEKHQFTTSRIVLAMATYTGEGGASKVESIFIAPLSLGESLLMTTFEFPIDTDVDVAVELLNSVEVWIVEGGRTLETSPGCEGADAWWIGTALGIIGMEWMIDQFEAWLLDQALARAQSASRKLPEPDIEHFAQRFAASAQTQWESTPPPVGTSLNNALIRVYEAFALYMDTFALVLKGTIPSYSDLLSAQDARKFGLEIVRSQLPILIQDFVDQCRPLDGSVYGLPR